MNNVKVFISPQLFQFCTTLGATIVPMTFITVDELTQSIPAAVFASLLIIFGKIIFRILT